MLSCSLKLTPPHVPGSAPILEMLVQQQTPRPRRSGPSRAAGAPPTEGWHTAAGPRHAPKRLFLAELEVAGSVSAACAVAGCTPAEVRRWKAHDQMFSRDFTLALLAHMRALKHMLREVAAEETGARAERARALLASEGQYVGIDGRLDLRAWCDALKGLVIEFGLDLERWEPKQPAS